MRGIKFQLLHPIFDQDILSRLRLVTQFDTSGEVVEFILGYRHEDFDEAQRSRINAHINMCVDQRAFTYDTKIQISTMAARVAQKNIFVWKQIILDELVVMDSANLAFGWKAACLRGFLELNEDQLIKLIGPKILP